MKIILAVFTTISLAMPAFARDNVHVAGSSTVLPYATIVAEAFGENFEFKTPVVEGGGSGAGRKKLCQGVGETTIDIANSSSKMKDAEYADCATNGVTDVKEVRFGYDGIVFASDINGAAFNLTAKDLYLALSASSTATKWSEVKPFCAAAKANGTPAYGAPWATGWPTIMHSYSVTATLLYSTNTSFTDDQYDGKATFAASPWVKSFEMLEDMNSWGCFNASPNSTTYAMTTDDLAKGKILGWLGLPTIVPALTAIAPAGTTWSFAAHPATDNAKDTIIPSAILRVFALNKKAANNLAAKKFIDFLAAAEARKIFVGLSGGIPAGPVPGYVPSSPAIAEVMKYRAQKRTFLFIDQQWQSPKVQQALIAGVQAIFAGTDTPKGVAEKMDKALQGK